MGTTFAGTTDASPVYYRFHKTGFQVTNAGNAYVKNTSTTAFQVQNAAGTSVFTVDTSNTGNLTVAGVAPVSLAGAGTAASNILTVTGPAGGATSGITSQVAGAGSAISVTTGNGGAATGVSGSQTGGAAGAITFQGGTGGAATSGTGGAGANVTINGGNGGSGSVTGGAGGRLTLAGGNVGSGGTPTAGYVLVKNAANSPTAFQIQNATNSQIFTVDTSGSQIVLGKPGGSGISGQIQFANAANANTVTIVSGTTTGTYQITLPTTIAGSNQCLQSGTVSGGNIPLTFGACGTSGTFVNLQGSSPGTADTGSINLTGTIISAILKVGDVTNGITLDPSTGPDYHGTARPTKRISQSPEYLGAVLRGDGSSNTGTLTTSFDATNFHNYYNWTTNQVTNQDFDVATRVAIPNDYSSLTLTPQLCMYGWSDDLTNGTITANVNDSSNTAITLSSSSFTPGSASTWAETCRTISGTPTLTAGGFITLRVTLQAANTKNTRLGEFRIDYLGKF